jgi:GntR family transcriptional regulator/MocR family aminotransferase
MPRTRTRFPTELLVQLRRDDPLPLHHQLEQELRGAIRTGRLRAESPLPSTRVLAGQLELSRGVVVEAYEQLVAEGYLTSLPGGATRVAADVHEAEVRPTVRPTRPEIRINFAYGRPDVTQFPRGAWLRSLRRALEDAPSDRFTYLDRRGAPELRDELAAYLNRVRGTAADGERIVVCNGFAQAIDLVVQLVKAGGGQRIAVEDPGEREGRMAVLRHGLEPVPIPVDEGGIEIEALRRADADAIVLTPAHHYPTGAVIAPDRRADIAAWARDRNALILEDDYDAEYRYDREPIGAIQGLAPDRVIYAGSASKTLAPGLRLGWMILPEAHVDTVGRIKDLNDRGSPSLDQLAFADFLSRGEFDRHLRRMRPIYRDRRDRLLAALRRQLPSLRPVGASAGLHVLAWLPEGVAEGAVVDSAEALGVKVTGVSPTYFDPQRAPGGLIFGYGVVTASEIEEGVRLVADAFRSTARRSDRPAGSSDRPTRALRSAGRAASRSPE